MFIEGTRVPGDAELSRVAGAIAARYGLSMSEMMERIAQGRFCVKSGIALDTAVRLAAELEALGALCVVVDEAGLLVSHDSAPVEPRAPMSSALAAAYHGEHPHQDLGVLGQADGLALATLDGQDAAREPVQQSAFQAFDAAAFAPPDAEQDDLQLAMAPGRSAPTSNPMGPVMTDAGVSSSLQHANQVPAGWRSPGHSGEIPSVRAESQGVAAGGTSAGEGGVYGAVIRLLGTVARAPRIRFAAGVFLAVLLGFIPAHIVAAVQESSAYADIDEQVNGEQAEATSLAAWQALDEFRDEQLARKQRKQRTIAISALVVWAAFGVGLAFLWFRNIDWDAHAGAA